MGEKYEKDTFIKSNNLFVAGYSVRAEQANRS